MAGNDLDISSDFTQLYCYCLQPEIGQMISCEGKDCDLEWFHYECVGISDENVPDGDWFCDECKPISCPTQTTQGPQIIN